MTKRSHAWKDLERTAAEKLGGVRMSRGDDFGASDVDVRLGYWPEAKIDCKHRVSTWAHETLLAEVRRKYCERQDGVAILITKGKGKHGEVVSLSLDDFAALVHELLDTRRELETALAASDRACAALSEAHGVVTL